MNTMSRSPVETPQGDECWRPWEASRKCSCRPSGQEIAKNSPLCGVKDSILGGTEPSPLGGVKYVLNGEVTRPMRSVNPDQAHYCGPIVAKSKDGTVLDEYKFGIASMLSKKELLQEGHLVDFRASQTKPSPKELCHHGKEAGHVHDRAKGPSQGAKERPPKEPPTQELPPKNLRSYA